MTEFEQQRAAAAGQVTESTGSIVDSIINETKLGRGDAEARAIASRGLRAILAELSVKYQPGMKINQAVADHMMAELDAKLSRQLDVILHHPQFQRLESSWRGLKLLIERTDFRENNKIALLNASKEDLLQDFDDAPEIVKSGFYKQIYSPYGTYGGKPVGAIIGNYELDAGPQDMTILQNVAKVAAIAHAPFISAVSSRFLGEDSWMTVPNLKDLKGIFEQPEYVKWRSFRDSEDARYVGLTAPRFLLRLPYGQDTIPVKEFNYQETVTDRHENYLWGNTAWAFATRLTDSFAKYRFCSNIIGPRAGGTVEDLPVHTFEAQGSKVNKIPTEVQWTERRDYELSEEGIIGLTMQQGSDNAAFFGANSAQRPKTFPNTEEGKAAEFNFKLGTRLPYLFMISRIAHYVKVIQRLNIGRAMEKNDIHRELSDWLKQYVSDMENPSAAVRAKRPFRQGEITVEDIAGEPGWYRVGMKLRPHFKVEGFNFTMSLVGKLDKK